MTFTGRIKFAPLRAVMSKIGKSFSGAVVCCAISMIVGGNLWADFMYDPLNPRPTESDVWAAEHNAHEHRQKAVEAMGRDSWKSIEEQQKANRAQQDADEMRNRIWQNEQEDRRRRDEEIRRREEERRKEDERRLEEEAELVRRRQVDHGEDHSQANSVLSDEMLVPNQKSAGNEKRTFDRKMVTNVQPERQPPNPFDYYRENKKYPGEFGEFNKLNFCTAYNRYYGRSGQGAENAAKMFRREWEYGQFFDNAPTPEIFRGAIGFGKAYAGWSFKQEGIRLNRVRDSALQLRVEKAKLWYLLWENENQKRIKAQKELEQLEQTARKWGIDLSGE